MTSSWAGDDAVASHLLLQAPEFIELRNFLPLPGRDFRNTCFVAVVANLRHLLHPVRLETSRRTWTQFVTFVRRELRDAKAKLLFSATDGDGQHDAAELLGEFLSAVHNTTFGTRIKKTKYNSCCDQTVITFETLPMIVLGLPPAWGEYSLRTLIQRYEEAEDFFELECDFCSYEGYKHVDLGSKAQSIYDTVDGKMVFRFNRYGFDRYGSANRRADRILLDTSIISETGDTYNLEAILQHQGVSQASGHYIIYVLVSGQWEERDDAVVRRTDLTYEPSNVRLVET